MGKAEFCSKSKLPNLETCFYGRLLPLPERLLPFIYGFLPFDPSCLLPPDSSIDELFDPLESPFCP